MNLLRPAFDTACERADIPIDLRSRLWAELVSAHVVPPGGRPAWSKEALVLIEPLRIELDTLRKQALVGVIRDRYGTVDVRSTPTSQPIKVMDAYALYVERVDQLRHRMHTALRAGGHYGPPSTLSSLERDTIEVIVANERAAGRHAGTKDWTQWEDPDLVRKLTKIFDMARRATAHGKYRERGRIWQPFMPRGANVRGAAATSRLKHDWTAAFHAAVREHDHIQGDAAAQQGQPLAPLAAFYAGLRAPAVQSAIVDAIAAQVEARKGPGNPAFKASTNHPTRNIWHALALPARMRLASALHAALLHAYEAFRRVQDTRFLTYSPTTYANPWELTEEEQTAAHEARITVVGAQDPVPTALDNEPDDYEPVDAPSTGPVWEDVPPPEGYVNNPGTLTEEWLLANARPEKER